MLKKKTQKKKYAPEIIIFSGITSLLTILIITLLLAEPEKEPQEIEIPQEQQKTPQNTLIISFDVDFPDGVGFPENMPQKELLKQIPNEKDWKTTIKDLINLTNEQEVVFQFNIVGTTAELYPKTITSLSEEGMAISCHGYSHKRQSELNREEMVNEADKCKKALKILTNRNIKGFRFPYTNYTEHSFLVLEESGFSWDSSVWQEITNLRPYKKEALLEIPIFPIPNDWQWFILNKNNDSKAFFEAFKKPLTTNKGITYTILLHPWVLSLQREENIRNLRNLILFAKESNIAIKSGDQVYEEYKTLID